MRVAGRFVAILTVMGRNLAAGALVAAATLALAACARPDAPMAGNLDPPGTPRAIAATDPPGPVSDLQPCGDIGSAATPPDCYLRSHDSAGLTFEIRHHGHGQQSAVTVTTLDPEGTVLQTLTEPAVGTTEPRLRDVDNDGRDELIIPVMAATANIRYVIYHAAPDGTLQRSGELTGIGLDTSAAGYTVITARDSYELWKIQFWTFDAAVLHPLVTVEVHFLDDGTGHVGGSECTVVDTGGLARTGLSPDQATAQFCAEPTVLRVKR